MSISVKELNKLDKETYELIDIRSDAEIAHGVMPGAIQVSVDEIENNDKIDYSKKLVIVCARGKNSIDYKSVYISEFLHTFLAVSVHVQLYLAQNFEFLHIIS